MVKLKGKNVVLIEFIHFLTNFNDSQPFKLIHMILAHGDSSEFSEFRSFKYLGWFVKNI